ncbi:MAG TPA: YkvA family protein [Woeseiaceae bacterium]|nr:YkvA family protein [Woeseiaceae bacterium]
MTLRISIDLEESDLDHFRLIMKEARRAAGGATDEEIVAAADNLLGQVSGDNVPAYIRQRLDKLRVLTDMLRDGEWKLPDDERRRVINALAYFAEPEDLIPDDIPGLGFLDDAIMVELVVRELRHEIDAYQDFCDFRVREEARQGRNSEDPVTREEWLRSRRRELHSRMRRRRSSERKRDGSRRSLLALF